MLKNLRVRLTLLYLAVGILLVFLLGGVTYVVLYYNFQNSSDLALKTKMATVFTSLGVPLPTDLLKAEQRWSLQASHPIIPFAIEEPDTTKEDLFDSTDLTSIEYQGELSSIFVLPLDLNGTLVFNPNPYKPPMQPDQNALKSSQANGFDLRTVILADGTYIRLLTYQLPKESGFESLQLGAPIENQLKILNQFLERLLIIGSASILVLGVGSWWQAGRVLSSAQEAWDRQQLFIANASHELRAPLTLVRAGSDALLRKTFFNTGTRNLLKDIVSEIDYMNNLVEDLLLLSRFDTGQLKIRNDDVHLNELADEIQRQFQPLTMEKSIKLSVQTEKITIRGDMVRLRQVVLILLDNALRYTPKEGVIQLVIKKQDNHAAISVTDSGEGISKEHLAHVFERFYQVESDRRKGNSGSGLGLSIAKSIIEAHGGKISIQSEAGKGTTVICILPISNKRRDI